MHTFNISGLQTIKVSFFILLFVFVPPFLSPLGLPVVSPLCLPRAVIPMQRVGVSVLRQRARALVENESEQRFQLRKKLFFGGLGGARFPGPSKVANCQSVEDCKKWIIFRDIDGATPTHSPKSGWECPH